MYTNMHGHKFRDIPTGKTGAQSWRGARAARSVEKEISTTAAQHQIDPPERHRNCC